MLKNKNILVVGAAGLLGRGLVTELIEQGAHVFAADVNLEHLSVCSVQENWNENKVERICLDITNEDEVGLVFSKFTKLDGVVNCAYPRSTSYGEHFFDVSLKDFNENLTLQLGSAFTLSQACARYFKVKGNTFSLVNISSIYGVVAPKFDIYQDTTMTMPVEYAAVKSGLIQLTKYLVNYVNNSEFRANCVSPGGIYDKQNSAFVAKYTNYTHGKGMLDSKDVFGSIVFLLSDQSRYVTGQNLVVDDGFSL